MYRFLGSSKEVYGALRELFSLATRRKRRVALVAYVGRDATSLLPDFTRVELYCWPQVGATDPYSLAELQSPPNKVQVRLVDQLHMKLYWVEGTGFVVTSANLSKRALGDGIREEVGIHCTTPSVVPIDSIIGRLNARPLRRTELKRLQRQHDEYWARRPPAGSSAPRRAPSLARWNCAGRLPEWKLGWYDGYANEQDSTSRAASRRSGSAAINDFLPCSKAQLSPGDWVLTFKLDHSNRPSEFDWLRVDFVNELTPLEAADTGFTHEAVQLRPLSPEHRPPFRCDKPFGIAFAKALESYGVKNVKSARSLAPHDRLLRVLLREGA